MSRFLWFTVYMYDHQRWRTLNNNKHDERGRLGHTRNTPQNSRVTDELLMLHANIINILHLPWR